MTSATSHAPGPPAGGAIPDTRAKLEDLVGRVRPAGARGVVRRVFADLARLLALLDEAEQALSPDGPFDAPLAALAEAHAGAELLHEFIRVEARGLEQGGDGEALHDVLDGMTYALRHELRRVYGDELRGLDTLRRAASVASQIRRAVSLLRNCFRQATVTLAQVFDPSLDGAAIFGDRKERREESLALSKELCVLAGRARRAAVGGERASVVAFVEGLKRFRRGSMHHLMYRDWHEFERHARKALGARGAGELTPVLEEFSSYLEHLLAQVRRRAVLAGRAGAEAAEEI